MLAILVIFSLAHTSTLSRRSILVNTLLVEGMLAVLPVVIYGFSLVYDWFTGAPSWPAPWGQLAWSWAAFGWGCLAAVPPLVVIWLIDVFPVGPLKKVQEISERFLRPLLRECRLPDFFLLATLAGFCEELLFRGWLQPLLNYYFDVYTSVILTAVIFALCHFITVAYFVIAFLISVYLSWLLVLSDNLLVPMAAHGFYDLVALIVVMWPDKRERDGRPGGEAPVPSDQGGGDVGRGGQAEEVPGGSPAGEAGGGIGTLARPGEPALRGRETTGSEGAP
jgi:membrane protease YdiL (CAAX protease family)